MENAKGTTKKSTTRNTKKNINVAEDNGRANQLVVVKKNYIVGIGASAGGLEALQKLLTSLPSNTGFPYLIVQHLSPDYKSMLSEILAKYTDMPVLEVKEGMEIQPDCVYIIQPGKNMCISQGKIMLTSQNDHELNLPIDMFFRSLAEEAKASAIAIILSGTGSDGTNGIKSIKENDGMILVQDYDSAKFDGMPRSAMRTGLVDAQLNPEGIAMELAHIANASKKQQLEEIKTEKQIDDELMKKIYYILKKVSNVNFTHYKSTTIIRRIERRMMLTHKDTLSDYVEFLYESPSEVKTLSKEVLIGVTSFFRDPDFFQTLKEKAIQNIVLHSTKEEPIRIWVAGCSTGEEAYSIAILFCEVMDSLKLKRTVKIFATDLDMEAITVAGKGVYGDSIIDNVSPVRLSRYFTHSNNTYTVNRELRKMIVFSPHNVFQDPPFGRVDMISCRNMLIYFQVVLQNDLFAIFHTALKDNGYLFLGKSEAIGAFTEAFPVVDAAAKVFTHHKDVKIAGTKIVPYLQMPFMDDDIGDDVEERFSHQSMGNETITRSDNIVDVTLLEQFMPACIVINSKNEIVHTYGENSNYVHISLGKFSNLLYDVITEGLKVPVSTILKEARVAGEKVQYKDIKFKGEREDGVINLTVMPISLKVNEREQLYAIIFSEMQQRGETSDAVPFEIDRVASQRITDLEQELGEVQGKLDRSIAEQECVNEELQAANEELLTANEELQSSNEELQSVNEELYTVNSEYQQKLTELNDLNDDIANFLSTTLIGIIFVDNKLNLRRYTDYVTSEFSVMDHDIGRSLKFISYHFPTIDISEICDNVLKTLVPDEREVTTSKNKIFLMRVAPYRSTENKILGCVITLVDITTQKVGLEKLQNTEERLSMAQQANEEKTGYLSHIAHEIRTPMSTIIELAKLTKANINDKSQLLSNLDEIVETVDYMASIVTDISDASRSENIIRDEVLEKFTLDDVIRNVKLNVSKRFEKAGITFDVIEKDGLIKDYIGNKTALQEVLINFLNNSLKYTKEGGSVLLKITKTKEMDNKICLGFSISDTGIGISKQFLPQIFKPYTREKRGDSNEQISMGLGLSIAYNLIQSMGGDVKVTSEVGKGSTFTIQVMMYIDNAENGRMLLESIINKKKSIDLKGCHVLMAEDNYLNRAILGKMLTHEGITYDEAADGEETVRKFIDSPEYTYDCILMDMRMPNVDGIRATMLIRASEKADANIPIIGVSANGFKEDIHQAEKAGVDGYVVKPIDKDMLLDTIGKLLKKNNEI